MMGTANHGTAKRVIVTGGSGLVGEAVKYVIANEPCPRYGKRPDEEWIFLNSKEGDLRWGRLRARPVQLTKVQVLCGDQGCF